MEANCTELLRILELSDRHSLFKGNLLSATGDLRTGVLQAPPYVSAEFEDLEQTLLTSNAYDAEFLEVLDAHPSSFAVSMLPSQRNALAAKARQDELQMTGEVEAAASEASSRLESDSVCN